jgi:hypothetical protein
VYLTCGHAPECTGALNVQRTILLEATGEVQEGQKLLVNYGSTFHKNILEELKTLAAKPAETVKVL